MSDIGKELVVVEEVIDTGKEIANILKPEVVSDILERVREKYLTGFIADVSTAKGRDEIRNRATKPTKVKTTIGKAGENYVRDLKKEPNIVLKDLKLLKEGCDAIRDEIRAPLTEWENIRKEVDQKIMWLASKLSLFGDTSDCIAEELEALLVIDEQEIVEDKRDDYAKALSAAITAQHGFLAQAIQEENDKEELERLRLEKAAKEAEEQKRKEIADAKAAAKKEAEEAAEKEILQAKLDKAEADKAVREAEEAAEKEILQAKREAEQAKADAEKKAKEAAENARKEAEAEAERKRAEEQRLKDEAEQKERERQANEQHRKKIRNEAETSFRTLGYSSDEAERIVALIDSGKVSNISINY